MKTATLGVAISASVATAVLLSGCGGSSANKPAAEGSALPAGAASAIAKITSAGGPLDVSKLCAAVPQADIQKLFKDPAPKVTVEPGECDWGGGGMTVDIYLNDASGQYYTGGAVPATATPLAGVGDKARWSQPVTGATVPFIAVRKGNTDCTVSPGLDVDQTTMPYTGSAPFFKITDADALTYATEEGKVCSDILAAG